MEGHPYFCPPHPDQKSSCGCLSPAPCLPTYHSSCLSAAELSVLARTGLSLYAAGHWHWPPFPRAIITHKATANPRDLTQPWSFHCYLHTRGWLAHVALTLGKGGPRHLGPHWMREESHCLSWASALRSSPQVPCCFEGVEVQGSIAQQQPLPLHCSWH